MAQGQNGLFVKVDKNERFIFHKVLAKESAYSIKSIYGVEISDIKRINPNIALNRLNEGSLLKIPVNDQMISIDQKQSADIPLYYEARAKDNIFRISKIYFNQDIKSMMRRNKLTSPDISLGQVLQIGWLSKASQQPKQRVEQSDKKQKVITNNEVELIPNDLEQMVFVKKLELELLDSLEQDTVAIDQITNVKRSKAIAYWNKNTSDKDNLFVLHKTATPNSLIKIYSPLVRRSVWAQVIGPFDENLYGSNIDLVVSPRVAKALGMVDKRFQVELEYTE